MREIKVSLGIITALAISSSLSAPPAGAENRMQLNSSQSLFSSREPVEVQVLASDRLRFLAAAVSHADGPPYSTFFALSKNDGKTWSNNEIFLNKNFDLSVNPSIASSGNSLFRVVMSPMGDLSKGVLEFSRSSDKGQTWTPWKTIVSREGAVPDKPSLVVDQAGVLHLTYVEIKFATKPSSHKYSSVVRYLYSKDEGLTWIDSPIELPEPGYSRTESPPIGSFLLPIGSSVYISWGSYNNGPIVFGEIKSNKVENVRLVSPSSGVEGLTKPTITGLVNFQENNTIGIYWHDAHYQFGNIFFSLSRDAGKSWEKPVQISNRGGSPAFALDNERLYVTFLESDKPSFVSEIKAPCTVQWKVIAIDLKSLQVADDLTYGKVVLSAKGIDWLKTQNLSGYQTLLLKNQKLEGYLIHLRQHGGWTLKRDIISLPR